MSVNDESKNTETGSPEEQRPYMAESTRQESIDRERRRQAELKAKSDVPPSPMEGWPSVVGGGTIQTPINQIMTSTEVGATVAESSEPTATLTTDEVIERPKPTTFADIYSVTAKNPMTLSIWHQSARGGAANTWHVVDFENKAICTGKVAPVWAQSMSAPSTMFLTTEYDGWSICPICRSKAHRLIADQAQVLPILTNNGVFKLSREYDREGSDAGYFWHTMKTNGEPLCGVQFDPSAALSRTNDKYPPSIIGDIASMCKTCVVKTVELAVDKELNDLIHVDADRDVKRSSGGAVQTIRVNSEAGEISHWHILLNGGGVLCGKLLYHKGMYGIANRLSNFPTTGLYMGSPFCKECGEKWQTQKRQEREDDVKAFADTVERLTESEDAELNAIRASTKQLEEELTRSRLIDEQRQTIVKQNEIIEHWRIAQEVIFAELGGGRIGYEQQVSELTIVFNSLVAMGPSTESLVITVARLIQQSMRFMSGIDGLMRRVAEGTEGFRGSYDAVTRESNREAMSRFVYVTSDGTYKTVSMSEIVAPWLFPVARQRSTMTPMTGLLAKE